MIAAIARRTHGMLTLLHCEDGALVRFAGQQLLAGRGAWPTGPAAGRCGRAGGGRPGGGICEATGSPIYIVRLSSAAALTGPARPAGGLPVFVESRPLYLYLTSEALREPDGGKYIGARRCASSPTWRRSGRG